MFGFSWGLLHAPENNLEQPFPLLEQHTDLSQTKLLLTTES
jgi:hypothetical protein